MLNWLGTQRIPLIALDELLGNKGKGRKSIDWYKAELAKVDKKALTSLNAAYDTLHLAMNYDGNSLVDISKAGLELADSLIIELKLATQQLKIELHNDYKRNTGRTNFGF